MDNKFSVIENGILKEYEIVKLCKKDNANYIIYKDNTGYYSSRYNMINNNIVLEEIIDTEEWDFIDKCLGELYE